jgi:hypothetical protein
MLCKLGHNIDFARNSINRECYVCIEEDCEESIKFQGGDDYEDEDEWEV